ncbi:MAG: hypothetical protein RIS35_2406 [Pseudomonadota bacterium]
MGYLSWGAYPAHIQRADPVHWRGRLPDRLAELRNRGAETLPYGNGRSYGDSCLAASDHVLAMRPLDRLIAADWGRGVIRAEAGVTLDEILRVCVPRGWFVPVTPGTKYVTLGGAVANDVHGKNHHARGTFGRHVRRFGLVRSAEGRCVCSPSENPALFQATIGGLGLTGVIEWVEFGLVPIASSRIVGVVQRFGDLDEFFALSDELDGSHEFCVSWIDCAGRAAGRGIYSAGDFATEGPLEYEAPPSRSMPWTPPFSLINPVSLRAFNFAYWHASPLWRSALQSGYEPFFYPLDAVRHWNRVYGRRGFQQYQCLVPERDARAGIAALLDAIAKSGTGSFLAVLKRCGDLDSPGLMSFPAAGTTLALDFPQQDRLSSALFPRLDAIVREVGGRLYPAKDAHMSGDDFRRAYPQWERLEQLRDPTMMSRFWARVTRHA